MTEIKEPMRPGEKSKPVLNPNIIEKCDNVDVGNRLDFKWMKGLGFSEKKVRQLVTEGVVDPCSAKQYLLELKK